ncbi:GATA-type domain-containing protein [Trichostrongylus colubriformis]|uniref:GATA-type domain-containing protein n=1 Tax=Trichostrongylus colubriformis TaxID=6319 RepID=A0AAN8IRG0_TRICO
MEAQGRQPDFAQFQKAVARHRRNGRAALKTSAQQSNECPLPSTLSENADQAPSEEPSFFVPHPDFPPQFSQFVPPNVEYNSQHAMLVGYTTDRALYDVGNVEHPLNPLGDGQVRFARHSHSIVRSPDGEVYGSHLLMTPPTESAAPLEVCKQEVLHEEYNASQGEITSHDGNEQYEQFEQAPAQYESLPFDKKASGNDLVDGNDPENHCVNDYKVVKEEDNGNVKAEPVNGSLAFTASAPGSLLEVQQESISPRDSAFDLLDACPEDDNVLVFRSL